MPSTRLSRTIRHDDRQRVLLDTNIVSNYMRGERSITEHWEDLAVTGTLAASVITEGELLFGSRKAAWGAPKVLLLQQLISKLAILPIDREVAQRYSMLRSSLEAKGQSVDPNDLWIASTALRWAVPLVTRDGIFKEIPDLVVFDWLA